MKKIDKDDDIYALLSATTYAAVLGAAIETGLLWRLADQPLSANQILRDLHIPGKRGYYWLQLLADIGVIASVPAGYALTPVAREVILGRWSESSWKHLAQDERERAAGVQGLALYLGEPGSIWQAQGLPAPRNYVEKMIDSPDRAREFTRMLLEVHQPLARAVSAVLDLTGVHRLMDFGGGSGVISISLLAKYPALSVTVVDIENVCVAGREIATELSLSDRLSYQALDFKHDELPSGFDMILQCDVNAFGEELAKKQFNALKPGGRMVHVNIFSPDELSAPPARLEWTFLDSLADPDVSIPTMNQVQDLLTAAGFILSPEIHTVNNRWTVLQARKP